MHQNLEIKLSVSLRRVVWAACLLACLFAAVQTALAHAALVSSEPEPGQTVEALPMFFRLTFTDSLGEGSSAALLDENFGRIDLISEIAGQTLLMPPPAELAPGVYTMQYDVLSEDGHTISGSFEFALAGQPEPEVENRWQQPLMLTAGAAVIGFGISFLRRRIGRR